MIRILFVCHGNICRSPMAESVLKHLVAQRGLSHQFFIDSAATSGEEIGNPVHHGTVSKLRSVGVPLSPHRATRLTQGDYDAYDLLIGMDSANLRNMHRMVGGDPQGKLRRFLDASPRPRDIADPWYTGNFDATYQDVLEGCESLLEELLSPDAARNPL